MKQVSGKFKRASGRRTLDPTAKPFLTIAGSPHSQPSLRDIWGTVLPRFEDTAKVPAFPLWPPDLFALCAYALKQQSRYVRVVSEGWPSSSDADREKWLAGISRNAIGWLEALPPRNKKLPLRISKLWKDVVKVLDVPLPDRSSDPWEPDRILMELLSISDEACRYFHRKQSVLQQGNSLFAMAMRYESAARLVRNRQTSLCEEIPPSRLRVLLKSRTPQRGLTLRSLSLHAALVEGNEINARSRSFSVEDDLTANVLVIPWPFTVHPSQLRGVHKSGHAAGALPPDFRFFTFEIRDQSVPANFWDAVGRLVDQAEVEVGGIRFVILPELSLSKDHADKLAKLLDAKGVNLICGVGIPAPATGGFGQNYVAYHMGGGAGIQQHKHHRWKLDESQISQYSAGSRLPIGADYWEHIDLSSRTLTFIDVQSWLKVCALVCEDLARPDPVGDVIRAVGPNLTIALLMDGPQLENRWPARHAMILADDPGSSVLSITSLGMCALSRPSKGPSRTRVVALWKEGPGGAAQEIELPADRDCLVLSLSMRKSKDWAADGRTRTTATPVLTGIRFYKLPL